MLQNKNEEIIKLLSVGDLRYGLWRKSAFEPRTIFHIEDVWWINTEWCPQLRIFLCLIWSNKSTSASTRFCNSQLEVRKVRLYHIMDKYFLVSLCSARVRLNIKIYEKCQTCAVYIAETPKMNITWLIFFE